MYFLMPLVAAIIPFAIWPVEIFLPYPYIIEEIANGFLVFFVVDSTNRNRNLQVRIVLASAITFTLSETVLYILNIAFVGDLSTLLIRFILTALLHGLTMLVILIFAFKSKWFIPVGVLVTMLIHYLYNLTVNLTA